MELYVGHLLLGAMGCTWDCRWDCFFWGCMLFVRGTFLMGEMLFVHCGQRFAEIRQGTWADLATVTKITTQAWANFRSPRTPK